MGSRTRTEIPKEIRDVQQKFDQWRHSRSKRGPIPEPLWKAATALANTYGVYTIARLLRLNSKKLIKRTAATKASNPVTLPAKPPAAFIELEAHQLQLPVTPARHCQIEFAGANRCTMTVRLTGWSHGELVQMARAWVGSET